MLQVRGGVLLFGVQRRRLSCFTACALGLSDLELRGCELRRTCNVWLRLKLMAPGTSWLAYALTTADACVSPRARVLQYWNREVESGYEASSAQQLQPVQGPSQQQGLGKRSSSQAPSEDEWSPQQPGSSAGAQTGPRED